MKIILPLFLLAVFASCGPSRYIECPKAVNVVFNADSIPPCVHGKPNCKCLRIRFYDSLEKAWGMAPDTTCEWMHISMRDNGFVLNRKAFTVKRNGVCIAHLAYDKTPFPVHWHVGWCQGKDSLLMRLTNEGRVAR